MTEEMLLRVCSNRFCAGIIVRQGRIRQAAPILGRWIGRSLEEFLTAAKTMPWHLEIVP